MALFGWFAALFSREWKGSVWAWLPLPAAAKLAQMQDWLTLALCLRRPLAAHEEAEKVEHH